MLGTEGTLWWLRWSQMGRLEYKVREDKRKLKEGEWNMIMEKEAIKIIKQIWKEPNETSKAEKSNTVDI